MSSFIAAGTAYASHGIPTLPFFIYYSMFGFQRIGDLIWAAADMRVRGFLLGGTAGRTTLNGEGLQHQDGHSHVLASTVPNCLAYDPAFAYEIAVIIQDGIRRMYEQGESVFYYLTLGNENYPMEPMPDGRCRGDSARHVQIPCLLLHSTADRFTARGIFRPRSAADRSPAWQRTHSSRGAASANPFGGQVRGGGGRLERHQLQGACGGTVWSANAGIGCIPRRRANAAISKSSFGQREGRLRGRQRLHEIGAGNDRPLGAGWA